MCKEVISVMKIEQGKGDQELGGRMEWRTAA